MQRLFQYLQFYRQRFYLATTYSVINKLFDLMPPLLVGWMVDIVSGNTPVWMKGITGNDPWTGAIFIAILVVGIFTFESFFEWLYQKGFMTIALDVQHKLRVEAYAAMQEKELAFFENNRTGNLLSILNDDINRLERFLSDVYNELLQVAILVIFSAIAFFTVSWELALIGLIPIPFIIGGSIWYQKKIAPYYGQIREEAGSLNSRLENNLGGIQVIKSFTSEKLETQRVEVASETYRKANYSAIKWSVLYVPMIRNFITFGFAGVLLMAAWWIIQGDTRVTIGELALYGMLIQRLLWPMTRLGKVFDDLQRAKASVGRVFSIVDAPSGIKDDANAKEFKGLQESIQLQNVSFKYTDDGQEVLGELNLEIPKGKTLGIAGPTGAGKTSLIKLLLRYYEPVSGMIMIDREPMSAFTIQSLRKHIALVSQDVYLFQGTIRENISYGMPYATEEQILIASKKAAMHDFVMGLKDGYDTLVGERGIKLSGGQRQRLSIARAILKDAPIIILDEATSAVDTETERIIQENLQLLTTGKTAIMIAHRLSTLRKADNIVLLNKGNIAEIGNHDALIEQQGIYAQLWNIQTGAV